MKLIHFVYELESLADSNDLFIFESDVEKIMMNRTYFVLMIKNQKKQFLCKNSKNRTFLLSYLV